MTISLGAYRSSQLPSARPIDAVGSEAVRSLVRATRTAGSSPQRTDMYANSRPSILTRTSVRLSAICWAL